MWATRALNAAIAQRVCGLQRVAFCAKVSGAAGRFLRCVMMNITTGMSSRFGLPWPQHVWHIWDAQGCNLAMLQPKIV